MFCSELEAKVDIKGVVKYDFCLSINNRIKVTTLKVQSKGRYLLLKKRTTKKMAGRDYTTFLQG